MASFLSMNDPEFWKQYPQELKELVEMPLEGVTGLAYFLLGDRKDNPPHGGDAADGPELDPAAACPRLPSV